MDMQTLVERVKGEFNEMPGLRLTPEQAARQWNLEQRACGEVLTKLVAASFLRWSAGSVVRAA